MIKYDMGMIKYDMGMIKCDMGMIKYDMGMINYDMGIILIHVFDLHVILKMAFIFSRNLFYKIR